MHSRPREDLVWALVNIDRARKMSALSSQRWLVTLSNHQEFIVSKRQAHNVRQLLAG
jgi:DNA-binding LytR/AlgR family response regulator